MIIIIIQYVVVLIIATIIGHASDTNNGNGNGIMMVIAQRSPSSVLLDSITLSPWVSFATGHRPSSSSNQPYDEDDDVRYDRDQRQQRQQQQQRRRLPSSSSSAPPLISSSAAPPLRPGRYEWVLDPSPYPSWLQYPYYFDGFIHSPITGTYPATFDAFMSPYTYGARIGGRPRRIMASRSSPVRRYTTYGGQMYAGINSNGDGNGSGHHIWRVVRIPARHRIIHHGRARATGGGTFHHHVPLPPSSPTRRDFASTTSAAAGATDIAIV